MEQVGRYQILEELGRGAHGIVYKALDPAIGRQIAIKAIALDAINPSDRERVRSGILREARLAGTLSHPNIVTVYDVLDQDDAAFIIMEYVDGRSLEEAIATTVKDQRGKLSRQGFISTFKQVAQALDYAHRKRVIHRDIKPANIVLTDPRNARDYFAEPEIFAKIADFGVAKFVSHEVTQQVNGHGNLIGTPSYMSPEQIQGASVTGASDQFSLAVIAYEVLCGRKAFAADSIDALFYQIRNERETPVTQVNSALSPTIDKVMDRALSKSPEDRFGSCSEFAGALEFALGDSPVWEPGIISAPAAYLKKPGPVTETVPVEAPLLYEEERSRGKTWALIGLLCVAVALAIVWIVRMNSGPAVATQVLDTRNGPISVPPSVQELKYDRRTTPPPLDLGQAPAGNETSPAITKSTSPQPPPAKAPVLQPVKQVKPSKPEVSAIADVQITSDPPGANITVDKVNSCYTPCSLTLGNGRHTLAANLDGYLTARRILNTPGDSGILLELQKSLGVLVVSSEPSGAAVNIDGQTAGNTPLTLRLAPGEHRVEVWDGSRWREQIIQINADEVDTRMFRF